MDRYQPVGLIGQPVQLREIRDVDAFVCAALRDLALNLTVDEHDELEAEGLAILWDLDRAYNPELGVPFAGYAAQNLRRRLITAWHLLRRGEHQRSRDETGRRVWVKKPAAASLDELRAQPTFHEWATVGMRDFTRAAAA